MSYGYQNMQYIFELLHACDRLLGTSSDPPEGLSRDRTREPAICNLAGTAPHRPHPHGHHQGLCHCRPHSFADERMIYFNSDPILKEYCLYYGMAFWIKLCRPQTTFLFSNLHIPLPSYSHAWLPTAQSKPCSQQQPRDSKSAAAANQVT